MDRRRSLTFRIGTFKPLQIYLRYYDIFPFKILPYLTTPSDILFLHMIIDSLNFSGALGNFSEGIPKA